MKKEKKQPKQKKNILYTGFGDKGTTTLFNCKQGRISKSANIIEALGEIDELNAYLGIIKVSNGIDRVKLKISNKDILFNSLIEEIQQTLFVIQAEIAGSKMTVNKKTLDRIENIINKIADILPPIKSFTISGGSTLSAELDYARTLTRRAERRIILVKEEKNNVISLTTTSYLNRLSSAFFAMSRYTNFVFSIKEDHPDYNK